MKVMFPTQCWTHKEKIVFVGKSFSLVEVCLDFDTLIIFYFSNFNSRSYKKNKILTSFK